MLARMIPTLRNPEADELVRRLSLQPHPEGGYFRELHRSAQTVRSNQHGERAAFTSILFLLEAPQVSRLHRLDAEELWSWHAGSPLDVHILDSLERRRVGPAADHCFQTVVPAGSWFGAEVASPDGFSLVGCVVAPGFEFRKFELAERQTLLREFPSQADVIVRLTTS
jgi:predicted cupin superfamily sugar epimerase